MNKVTKMKFLFYMIALLTILLTGELYALLPPDCGSLKNAYGPFDYTNPLHYQKNLPIVEKHHFTPNVQNLVKGQEGSIVSDLDYTLRAFPNHHLALYALIRYEYSSHHGKPLKRIECYFQRAITFQPHDATSWMLYGLYLHRKGQYKEALEKYRHSLSLNPQNAQTHYNLGLLYFKIEDYTLSLKHAKKAYALGYKMQGLKRKLKKENAWKD